MKICRACNENKPFSEFGLDSRRLDKTRIYCKPCNSKRNKDLRAARKLIDKVIPEFKLCRGCGETKPGASFQLEAGSGTGLMSYCKRCNRSMALIRKFGISIEVYDTMIEEQDGLCKICKGPCVTGRALAVDHCHKTQKVRGLLCTNCNTALGSVDDNIELLRSMINYLEENKS